ncbi:DUF3320 domain-containing protein [Gemmatimonadota bacterium]
MTPADTTDRIAYRLENWKRSLIDLTRRNRLLNYRPTRASTVEIVDEVPQQILRQLLTGEIFQFDPRPEEPDQLEIDELIEEPQEVNATRYLEKGQTLSTETATGLEDYHRDNRLQTDLTADRLTKNLINLYRRSGESLEEQGINTLFMALGMLEWYEVQYSEELQRSPLLMVPVEVFQETAASPFQLKLGNDDPILNLALTEKLRLDFSIDLPELPEITEDIDIDELFNSISTQIGTDTTWRLTSDVVLGLFSFQKFIMYKDLERNSEWFRGHSIIQALCREDEGEVFVDLPDDVNDADLDEEMSPWDTIQVLDADSSQQRAMLAVRKGYDLVIEGPPGTGKSQTIANLIADSLFQGKTVLFVSEKMAALEVVKDRIDAVGLGEYCLELHSNKGSKKDFIRQLSHSLDSGMHIQPVDDSSLRRLVELSKHLKKYVVELHQPVSPLGYSPFQAMAELATIEDAPTVSYKFPGVSGVALDRFEETQVILNDLTLILSSLGDPLVHPLRGFNISVIGRGAQRNIENISNTSLELARELSSHCTGFSEFYGLRVLESLGDVEVANKAGSCISRSPGCEIDNLEKVDWWKAQPEALYLIAKGRQYSDAESEVFAQFKPSILDETISSLYYEFEKASQPRLLRFLRPSYWKLRKRLYSYLNNQSEKPDNQLLLKTIEVGVDCQTFKAELEDRSEVALALFGSRWKCELTDWDSVEVFVTWAVEFEDYKKAGLVKRTGITNACDEGYGGEEGKSYLQELSLTKNKFDEALHSLIDLSELDSSGELQASDNQGILEAIARLEEINSGLHSIRQWSGYLEARNKIQSTPAEGFIEVALEEGIHANDLNDSFKKTFLEQWVDYVLEKERTAVGWFQADQHEGQINEFKRLDRESLSIARGRTKHALASRHKMLLQPENQDQLHLVQRESRKQRRILPIRKLMHRAPSAIQYIHPCFMMSPLSVAQFIDPAHIRFDLLIFDEASQIPPADAVGSIIRSDQVVVVGDSKQLPPTNFFSVHLDEDELEEEEIDLLQDLESILDEVATSGTPKQRLKWHYRSQHESLIRFSNEEFYSDNPLYVFPSAIRDDEYLGLKFEYISDGIYEGGGVNTIEARVVAEAVCDHIRRFPSLSLGVGTFGISQQTRILDELHELRRADPSIEWFFQQEGEDRFFVKNLENIQGDDRDTIFLSVTYGPDTRGVINRNFGPINKAGGWRRLNVLTTRAKRHLRVFSSMRGSDIDISNVAQGPKLLRQYLTFAETGLYPSEDVGGGEVESPFEAAVKQALEIQGYSVIPQVGDAGYRIDLGIKDDEHPGRFLCGIECDGASYHSAATVRERDRLRQEVLEQRGWSIYRVWSTDWFYNPSKQVERLRSLIEQTRTEKNNSRVSQSSILDEIDIQEEHSDDDITLSIPSAPRTELADMPVEKYRFAPVFTIGQPENFYEASPVNLKKVIMPILEIEGPIHIEELARRVASHWDMNRAGRKIVLKVWTAVNSMCTKKGKVSKDGDFFSASNQIQIPVRNRDIGGRLFPAKLIPPSEVKEAIRLLLNHRAPLMRDEIIRETAKVLGFARTGSQLHEVIDSAVKELENNDELRAGGKGIHFIPPVE